MLVPQNITVTGVTLLVIGFITLIPEIYFAAILVLAISSTLQMKQFETLRDESNPGQTFRFENYSGT